MLSTFSCKQSIQESCIQNISSLPKQNMVEGIRYIKSQIMMTVWFREVKTMEDKGHTMAMIKSILTCLSLTAEAKLFLLYKAACQLTENDDWEFSLDGRTFHLKVGTLLQQKRIYGIFLIAVVTYFPKNGREATFKSQLLGSFIIFKNIKFISSSKYKYLNKVNVPFL